jgi:PEP-CTERM motif
MKLRIASALMLVGTFLFCSAICSADSAPVGVVAKPKSNYGTFGLSTELSTPIDVVFTAGIGCPSTGAGCPAVGDPFLLTIITPNLPAGTVFSITFPGGDISGLDGLLCESSFLGACDDFNLTAAQQSCVNAINASFNSATDTFLFTVPKCSLTMTNVDFMDLVFDGSDFQGTLPSVKISTAVAGTPEPDLLMLLGAGLLGLWSLKRKDRCWDSE